MCVTWILFCQIRGTGPDGRVLKEDMLLHLSSGVAGAPIPLAPVVPEKPVVAFVPKQGTDDFLIKYCLSFA